MRARCLAPCAPQAAAFSLSQATTSYGWGLWSSRHGRKVCTLGNRNRQVQAAPRGQRQLHCV